MRVKEFEIKDLSKPFEECLLKREPFGHILTGLISGMVEGGVISLNNEWGTGKSTFLKMWKQHLENEEYITLEFNAWENDYEENPLVPLISEIKDRIGQKDETAFERILEVGGQLLIEGGSMALKKVLDKVVGVGGTDSLVDIVSGQAKEVLKDEIVVYKEKKRSLSEFKKLLGEYLSSNSEKMKLPLVFIIDELDRCRPDYAVKVLESVKHIFSVLNIVFVVSIDKSQLIHSINGFYGSENINSEEYLRRFFDLEISLPTPDKGTFIATLLKSNELEQVLLTNLRPDAASQHIKLIEELLNLATLRQVEKYIAYSAVVVKSRQLSSESYRLFFYLLYLKLFRNVDYKGLISKQLTHKDISELFFESLSHVYVERSKQLELLFAFSYNNMLECDIDYRHLKYYIGSDLEGEFGYQSKINVHFKEEFLEGNGRFRSLQNLDTIMKIIDLMP